MDAAHKIAYFSHPQYMDIIKNEKLKLEVDRCVATVVNMKFQNTYIFEEMKKKALFNLRMILNSIEQRIEDYYKIIEKEIEILVGLQFVSVYPLAESFIRDVNLQIELVQRTIACLSADKMNYIGAKLIVEQNIDLIENYSPNENSFLEKNAILPSVNRRINRSMES